MALAYAMFIQGIGTATPETRYAQAECWAALRASSTWERFTPRSRALLEKVLTGPSGIETRHLALNRLDEAFELGPDALHARFARHAPALAAEAARRAIRDAELDPQEIDAVLVSTCTGYLCPGLTSYVTELLGLRPSVFALDLVGQGCGAALPNLRAAENLLAAGRFERVLSICVEVCSAALYLDDDPGVLVSACLFGDGAGAVVLCREPGGRRPRAEWLTGVSRLYPEDRELLRFEQRGGRLRNRLSLRVPALAARHVAALVADVLRQSEVDQSQVTGWILHPGGRDVLLAVGQALKLEPAALAESAGVLRDFGNLSSPSVIFVLERALRSTAKAGFWVLSAFGAGFSCHAAVLQVEHKTAEEGIHEHGPAAGERTAGRIAGE